jgi:hypothetical protein
MSAKAFGLMLLVVVVLGGTVGGVLFAFNGNDADAPAIAGAIPDATATPTFSVEGFGANSITGADGTSLLDGTLPDGGGRFGGRQGLSIETVAGTLSSVSLIDLVVTSPDTGADTTVVIPPETPVRVSETAGDTTALMPGTEIVAFLQRAADGSINVTNVTVSNGVLAGGAGFGGGAFGGGTFGGGGGTTADGTEFNAVSGTITALSAGVLSLLTADGPVDATIADETPTQLTIPFADLDGELALESQVTIIGQRDDAGTFTPITVTSGELGGFGGRGGFGGGGGRRGQQGDGGFGGFQIPE